MKCCYCGNHIESKEDYFRHLIDNHTNESDVDGKIDGLVDAMEDERNGR